MTDLILTIAALAGLAIVLPLVIRTELKAENSRPLKPIY